MVGAWLGVYLYIAIYLPVYFSSTIFLLRLFSNLILFGFKFKFISITRIFPLSLKNAMTPSRLRGAETGLHLSSVFTVFNEFGEHVFTVLKEF